jgi:radical SAM-linked protein
MALDAPPKNTRLPEAQGTPPVRTKARIRFRKGGDLRLISHHDLMKCFERMLRRAQLPVSVSRGFHPKPRMVFALSLALGIVGGQEVLELEFDEPLTPDALHAALARQAPPGLEILSVEIIDAKRSAQPCRVCYRIAVPAERRSDLPTRIAATLAATECWALRRRPPARRVDVRPFLRDLRLAGEHLEIDLWVTPSGGARPEEILALLELQDLLDAGAVFERNLLQLHDEIHEPGSPRAAREGEAPAEPDTPISARQEPRSPGMRAPAGRPERPTALFPGPLSFDS